LLKKYIEKRNYDKDNIIHRVKITHQLEKDLQKIRGSADLGMWEPVPVQYIQGNRNYYI
jgi:hypothetical protein